MTEPLKPWEIAAAAEKVEPTKPAEAAAETPARKPWEVAAGASGPKPGLPVPESWLDVPEAYVKNAGQIAMDTVNAIPGVAEKVVKEPGKAVEGTVKGGAGMIKSLLSAAGMPLTVPAWAIASMLPTLPGAKKSAGADFRERYLEPGFALGRGLAEDYGGWLGGDEGWGFTPDQGLDRLKKTITTKPFSFTADAVGLPGAVGTVVRGGKTVAKVGHITDAAEAAKRLSDLGIDTEHLSAPQIKRLQEAGNASAWDKSAIERARAEALFDEAGLNPTSSMLTGNDVERRAEDAMRAGTKGPRAQEIIDAADAERRSAFSDYADRVRLGVSKAANVLDPEAIGNALKARWNAAHDAAREKVAKAYERAFNPAELEANGIPLSVPHDVIKSVPDVINNKGVQQGLTFTRELTPMAFEARKMLREYANTGRLPETLFGEPMAWGDISASSWQAVDAMRKQLNSLRNSAKANPSDLKAMRVVLDGFDETFGKSNSLLNDARKMHSERVKAFDPGRNDAPNGFKPLTNTLNNPANEGKTIYDTLFESGNFNSGRASSYYKKLMKTFENDPAAQSAIREGLMQRITRDPKSFETLSPQRMVTAINEALDGRRGNIYRQVLTDEDRASLKRMREVAEKYADAVRKENPPNTAHTTEHYNRADKIASRWGDVTASIAGLLGMTGGVASHGPAGAAGAAVGIPAYHAGRIAGRVAGVPIDNVLQGRQAGRLANPGNMTPMPPPMSTPLRGGLGVSALSNAEAEPTARKRGGHLSMMRRA